MQLSERSLRLGRQSLENLTESFRLSPIPDEPQPTAKEWGNYLIRHPGYADIDIPAAIILALAGRNATDGMGDGYPELAGALIGSRLTEQELLDIDNDVYEFR